MSALKKELVTVKESLNQTILEKDVLETAKEGLSGALSKVRVVDTGTIYMSKSSPSGCCPCCGYLPIHFRTQVFLDCSFQKAIQQNWW